MQGRPVVVHCRSTGWSPAFAGGLPAYLVNLPDQGVQIAPAPLRLVHLLAVGAETAQPPAEGDMDIQPQIFARPEGQNRIVLPSEGKGLDRPGQPHSGQLRNDTHSALLGSIHTNKDMLIIREWKYKKNDMNKS